MQRTVASTELLRTSTTWLYAAKWLSTVSVGASGYDTRNTHLQGKVDTAACIVSNAFCIGRPSLVAP